VHSGKWTGRGVIGEDGSIPSLRLGCPDEWPTETGIQKGYPKASDEVPEVSPQKADS
jgi:hypothetical protein